MAPIGQSSKNRVLYWCKCCDAILGVSCVIGGILSMVCRMFRPVVVRGLAGRCRVLLRCLYRRVSPCVGFQASGWPLRVMYLLMVCLSMRR
nr:MAG TPA: Protein of unknown function (DUF2757) [Caudoviricetes sp.]